MVLISIPLSLSIGLALLHAFGFTLNQLSIVGLVVALGLLVDDSIVVVENIERFMRQGYDRKEAAIVATKQIFIAVLGCTGTLIFAFYHWHFYPKVPENLYAVYRCPSYSHHPCLPVCGPDHHSVFIKFTFTET